MLLCSIVLREKRPFNSVGGLFEDNLIVIVCVKSCLQEKISIFICEENLF